MANESFANTLIVEVEGSPLAADVASLLTWAWVDASRNLPDTCALRFRDPQRIALEKGKFKVGAKIAVKVNTAEPGGPKPLMQGEITALELDLDAHGSFTEVRGLDLAHRLYRGKRVVAYPDMGLADIVRQVCGKASVPVGTIDSVPGVGGKPNTQFSQDNESDWEFLSRLADLVGAQISCSEGKLDFKLPKPPSEAPPQSSSATTDPLVLEANRNLISLRAAVTAAEQVPSVEVRGWDFEHKQEITSTETPKLAGTEASGVDPTGWAGKFKAPPYLSTSAAYHSQGEVKAAAKALADQLATAAAELDGVAKGNPKLRPGQPVSLAGVGDPFTGKYTLTSTRHLFTESAGYTTAFTVSHRQERSLYGVIQGGRTPGGEGAGLMPAIVSDVRDPLKLGRIKLTFPWLSKDFTSGWCRTVQLSAGKERGSWLLPEVGDEVLVGRCEGDMDTLYVLGGLHNGKDVVPKLSAPGIDEGSGEINVRALVSRKGHRLELVDGKQGEGILLSTGDKKIFLKFDVSGKKIELESPGEISVKGVGIKIDAQSGNLEMKGAQVKITGQQSAEMTATQVKVNGSGQAEFSAGGPVTVKGAIVRIN